MTVDQQIKNLIDAARDARLASYSPYSRFRVGAALLGKTGKVYLGTNVENASLGLTICAERTAVCRAVADGERDFVAIAVCADGLEPTPPCGACRQVLLEFGGDLPVYAGGEQGSSGPVLTTSTRELLAHAFTSFPSDEEDERT